MCLRKVRKSLRILRLRQFYLPMFLPFFSPFARNFRLQRSELHYTRVY